MPSAGLLIVSALILRTSGAAIRLNSSNLVARIVGWTLCSTAAWLSASAVGAWCPLWPALGLGLLGAVGAFRSNSHQFWSVADVFLMFLYGFFSIPPVANGLLIASVIVVAASGLAIDLLVVRSPRPLRIGFVLLPILAVGLFAFINPKSIGKLRRNIPYTRSAHIGLAPLHHANRILLETGAVGWIDYPRGKGPYPGALFFHGADRKGSKQSSAVVVRRALVDAGFVVLSVDHPGYGESPTPNLKTDLTSWDPLPTDLAALKKLRSMTIVDENRIIVLGHSAGTYEVFRLLQSRPEVAVAVVFGASLNFPREWDEYWYERFHSDRGMRERISRTLYDRIRAEFYDNGRVVPTIDPSHAPIVFVRFGREMHHLAETRDTLYKAIPGRKALWDIPDSSHYFNSFDVANLVVGDTNVTRLLASKFRVLAESGNPVPVALK